MRGHIAQIHQRNLIAQSIVKSGQHVVDPMAIAACHATLLTQKEIEDKILPMRNSVKAMTMGKGTFGDWVLLCSACNVAFSIEHFGVVRGYKEALEELEQALSAIGKRGGQDATSWKSPTLYAHEIKVLRMQCSDHKFQLSQLSYGEFIQAYDHAVRKCRSQGGEVFKRGELQ